MPDGTSAASTRARTTSPWRAAPAPASPERRRTSWRKSPTESSVASEPSRRATIKPSRPSAIAVGDQRDPERARAAVDALAEVEDRAVPFRQMSRVLKMDEGVVGELAPQRPHQHRRQAPARAKPEPLDRRRPSIGIRRIADHQLVEHRASRAARRGRAYSSSHSGTPRRVAHAFLPCLVAALDRLTVSAARSPGADQVRRHGAPARPPPRRARAAPAAAGRQSRYS